jgi:hypothetical protein
MTTRSDPGTKASGGLDPNPRATNENGRTAAAGAALADAAGTVKDVAADAAARLPEVAATTRTAIEDANRQLRAGSDEMLTVGSALSFGLAGGLLLGGASRFVVAAALLPAAMMALAMLDRSSRSSRPTSGRPVQGG